MWEKQGDAIRCAEDLVQAIKALCGIEGVYWLYPMRNLVSDDPKVVVGTIAHSSTAEWGGAEIAVTDTYTVDIFTGKQEKLEHFVKLISSNLLSNNVRTVGRTDGRSGGSKTWSAHLTVRASYDVYGRTFRGM
jgi:hypothetical protein